jgi:hypothetical protein
MADSNPLEERNSLHSASARPLVVDDTASLVYSAAIVNSSQGMTVLGFSEKGAHFHQTCNFRNYSIIYKRYWDNEHNLPQRMLKF